MEPIYEYERGKGWVQVLYPVFTMACGTTVRLEPRLPQNGEKFTWVYFDHTENSWHYIDKTPKLNRFMESYINDEYDDISEWDRYSEVDEDRVYVTFVKVG